MTRRKRTAAPARGRLQYILYGLCMVLLIAIWWKSSHPEAGAAPAPATPAQDLTHVEGPDGIPSRIVEYTGFRMSFNPDAHVPNWVAWELTGQETLGDVGRADNFMTDPDVEGCPLAADYRNSGFDRGHMCPAGDMKWNEQAMAHCFYFTNMCPQAKELNSGAWKSLEEKTRAWARRDSALVIVCGPVLTDRLTATIGPSRVVVPDRFFKVILAPYADPPRAIGFIMNNGRVVGGMQAAATSVDEVERITGLDFFSALPDDIETQVESQNNFAQWSRLK